ncbi:hypothetical protein niasHT_021947 [Heterodera trifolii]|uniref:Uncharacterized protein n=1 Tax=Heterodera trifolii TaxID=157864 RepID=A0ABD2K0P0_9BILA
MLISSDDSVGISETAELFCQSNSDNDTFCQFQTANANGPNAKRSSSQPSFSGTIDCVVCGARASGVHYMVLSCNGCKTFFRRAIMENRKYSCVRKGKCLINLKNRCCCRHCRFEKCRKVGMVFTELNVERKRRVNMAKAFILGDQFDRGQEDPLISQLLAKRKQFRTLLTSSFTPIFETIDHAFQQRTVFDGPMKIFENFQLRIPGTQLDFYDWRSRILSVAVEWVKSFSELQGIPLSDLQSLIVHCSFALLVFCEAFETPERFSDRLVYPDGLQVTRNFSKGICIPQNGLIRGIVAVINHILAPIRRIQLNEVEYVFIQSLLLFDSG